MKRIPFHVLLVAIAMLSLNACGKSDESSKETPKNEQPQPAPAASAATTENLVTIADVENVAGLSGIKTVPRDPSKGAGGDVNFATQDDNLVLLVSVSGGSLYAQSKSQSGYFHAEVSGIGDEAFDGPADENNYFKPKGGKAEPYFLIFRKGGSMVTLSSFLNMSTTKAYLSQAQLRELARIIDSRM